MRAAVIINKRAGTVMARELGEEAFRAVFAEAGVAAEVALVEGSAIGEAVKAARDRGAELIVVGGGDGSIATAAEVLSGTATPLGILPLGTANLLARDIGLPLDPAAAAVALVTGEPRPVDVGMVNGRPFLCSSMLGAPTHLSTHRERHRGAFGIAGLLRFWRAAWRALRRYPALEVEMEIAGRRRIRSRALMIVDNDYDEGLGKVFARSRLDRGHLTVYVARRLSVLRALQLAANVFAGRWRSAPTLERFATDRLVIRSRRKAIHVMNDGETALLEAPLRYGIRPGALFVIAPLAVPEAAAA